MPKKKKVEDPVKEYAERTIKGDFVPVDESDVARAVDVPVIDKSIEQIINKSNKKTKTKKPTKSVKKFNKLSDNIINFKVPGNKKLNENGPIMIVTEKPQASFKIANALAEGKIEKRSNNGVNYYGFIRGGKLIVVVCAVGHLFTLTQANSKNKWPVFDIKWAPNYLIKKNDFTKKYYDTIVKISKQASEIVIATDYDIEGEVIGMNIIKYICNQEDAERMKFSTLTSKEIQEAFDKRAPNLDWKQGIAGETRHYLDWIYGINLSRALMDAIKSTGNFRLMSIGRVQGPALHIIVNKEREIRKFVSEKYWQVFAKISDDKNKVEVKYVKDIRKEKELEGFKNLDGTEGNAETINSIQILQPPHPFDLTTLQTEAYKFFKITPIKTLQIAQNLYLSGVISYPRTSSQKIPKEIGYEKILNRLKENFNFVSKVFRKTPIEGKKTDPAHPSIFPTGEFHDLQDDDKKIYELIVKRFISCFCSDAELYDKKISVDINGKNFFAKGMEIKKTGWMDVYPNLLKEKELPNLNGKITVEKVDIEEKMTQPPHRYTQASIIYELEKKNLGTKATRAAILETLYDRKYIKGRGIEPTSLGVSLIETLEKNCDIIIDEKLTRDMEKDLDKLRESKNPKEKEQEILKNTEKIIYKIGEKFNENKSKIGTDLVLATESLWEEEKKENEVMQCLSCNSGKLIIKYGKKFNRYFISCDSYPKCNVNYSLPPNALIKKSEKICEYCNFPMLMSIKKGKRPWIFCFNPECSSRKK